MATNLNAFTVMGNVTADPKVFAKQNGFTSVLFQLAVNRGNATDFIPVQLYGAQYSDHVKSKLVKGAPVLVHGRVEYTSSEQNGESRKFFALQPGYMQIGPNGNMNTGIIFGRLTADPDIRQAKNGSKVTSITVACNRSYKDANGDWKDAPTTYIDVICWDKLGEFVGQYFRKGSAILVSGRLHSSTYKDKDGNTRSSYNIIAQEVSFGDKNLPLKHRIGYVLRKHVWEIYPKQELAITGILTEQDIAYFLEHAKDTVPDETRMSRMTANDFYRFCAIGYNACEYRSPEKTPKERYYLFADGRDEGLGIIDPDDPAAFEEWFNGGRLWGGHPWEVCSGGSSTHIDLDVLHDEGGWYLELAGSAWTRCAETVKFFVSLHKAGVPISVYQAELLKKRILGEEKVGIVPDGIYPSYCRDFFAEQDIIDYMSLPYDPEMAKRLDACCVWNPVERVSLVR